MEYYSCYDPIPEVSCLYNDDAVHDLKVYLIKGRNHPYDSFWEGYCTICGYVIKTPVRYIEDIFNE